MNNEEKVKKIVDSVFKSGLNTNRSFYDMAYNSALEMAQWKDEQIKQLLIEKTKLLSPSAAMDSVRRCTIEEIYEELFNERMPNSNPYIK